MPQSHRQKLHTHATSEHAESHAQEGRRRGLEPVESSLCVEEMQCRQPVEVLSLLHVRAGVCRQQFDEQVDSPVQVHVPKCPRLLRAGDEETQLFVARSV